MVVSVGIDVSKDKHDCFILSSDGEVLVDVFTIPNTMDGFSCLLQRIQDCTGPRDKIKVGLEAMDELNSPITTIPGLGFRMAAMIFAEVGDFTRFDSPDKLLAYAGMSPSTYQSGQLKNCYPHMEKRGSRYLRYAIYNATKYVCHWDPTFAAYLAKKRAEGKHYNVALSHAAKKLVRLIFSMEKSRRPYCLAA